MQPYSSVITFLILYILTWNIITSLSIGLTDSIVKIFRHYAFDKIWARIIGFRVGPPCYFLPGSAAGKKTTIAKAVIDKLKKKGLSPVLLDGDEIRHAIKPDGFDEGILIGGYQSPTMCTCTFLIFLRQ